MGKRDPSSPVSRPLPRALRGTRIGIIGAGKMGQALIKGLLAQGLSRRFLRAADASPKTRREVRRRFHLHVSDCAIEVVRQSEIIILAVRPQQFPELLEELAPVIMRPQLVISIAAGITLRWLKQRLPGIPLVRVMPNLPATVGSGFSVITLGPLATARHRAIARSLFGAVGEVCELPERYFDALTAVSGSGPAYVFFLVQTWEEAARALGLPAAIATQAIRQTLEGSTHLLRESPEGASVLVEQVASKGGTTEAALQVLAHRRVQRYLVEAIMAAAKRSKTLAWG